MKNYQSILPEYEPLVSRVSPKYEGGVKERYHFKLGIAYALITTLAVVVTFRVAYSRGIASLLPTSSTMVELNQISLTEESYLLDKHQRESLDADFEKMEDWKRRIVDLWGPFWNETSARWNEFDQTLAEDSKVAKETTNGWWHNFAEETADWWNETTQKAEHYIAAEKNKTSGWLKHIHDQAGSESELLHETASRTGDWNINGTESTSDWWNTTIDAIESNEHRSKEWRNEKGNEASDWLDEAGQEPAAGINATKHESAVWMSNVGHKSADWWNDTEHRSSDWIHKEERDGASWVKDAGKKSKEWWNTTEHRSGEWLNDEEQKSAQWWNETEHKSTEWVNDGEKKEAKWWNETTHTASDWLNHEERDSANWWNDTEQEIGSWISNGERNVADWWNRTEVKESSLLIEKEHESADFLNRTSHEVGDWVNDEDERITSWWNTTEQKAAAWFHHVEEMIAHTVARTGEAWNTTEHKTEEWWYNQTLRHDEVPQFVIYMNSTEAYRMLTHGGIGFIDFAQDYFLIQQGFDTQINQGNCAVASTAAILNSFRDVIELPIDPLFNPHPYATQADMFNHCTNSHVVRRNSSFDGIFAAPGGLSMLQTKALLDCHLKTNEWNVTVHFVDGVSINDFRQDLQQALANSNARVIINYHRKGVGQEGSGHFSPLGAYSADMDAFLVMDVAKYKYPNAWISTSLLYKSLQMLDACGKWDFPHAQDSLPSEFLHAKTELDYMSATIILGCEARTRGYITIEKIV